MRETEDHSHPAKPKWVEIGGFFISLATLAAVIFYGYQAWVANFLSRKVLAVNTRPYIQATPNMDPHLLTSALGWRLLENRRLSLQLGKTSGTDHGRRQGALQSHSFAKCLE